jgi:hypothetical protein
VASTVVAEISAHTEEFALGDRIVLMTEEVSDVALGTIVANGEIARYCIAMGKTLASGLILLIDVPGATITDSTLTWLSTTMLCPLTPMFVWHIT